MCRRQKKPRCIIIVKLQIALFISTIIFWNIPPPSPSYSMHPGSKDVSEDTPYLTFH